MPRAKRKGLRRGPLLNERTYFPILWNMPVPLPGARYVRDDPRIRDRQQQIGSKDPTTLGDVLLRGIKESA